MLKYVVVFYVISCLVVAQEHEHLENPRNHANLINKKSRKHHFSKSNNTSILPLNFIKYRPGKYEDLWIKNVKQWQSSVCSHLPKNVIDSYIASVQSFNGLDKRSLLAFITNENRNFTFIDYLSYYDYEYTDKKTGSIHEVSIPIESMIGLLRDPRKCYNEMLDTYTQSKEHFLPINGHILEFLQSHKSTTQHHEINSDRRNNNNYNNNIHNNDASNDSTTSRRLRTSPSSTSSLTNYPTQNYLFDCGATYYSDVGSQGMKWIIDWYLQSGIQILNVIGYEKKILSGDLPLVGVPEWLIPGFQYFNHAVETNIHSIWNPINMIKKKCTVDDFVILKLDIDHTATEKAILNQLLNDKEAISLIDEFYFEHHFTNKAMRMHGWYGLYQDQLSDVYDLFLKLRQQGFRIHYWP